MTQLPLFDQVPHTINASVFYDKSGLRVRASLLRRTETFFSVDTTNFALSRYQAPSTTLDLTASYRFLRHWTVFTEFSNVLNTPVRAYNGKENLRLDYSEYSDWSGNFRRALELVRAGQASATRPTFALLTEARGPPCRGLFFSRAPRPCARSFPARPPPSAIPASSPPDRRRAFPNTP